MSPSSTYDKVAKETSKEMTAERREDRTEWDPKNGSFKEWNRLADAMTRFHNHFIWEFDNAYKNADKEFANTSALLRFVREAEQLAHHLDMHHRIEEAYIFPLLAKKLPQFADVPGGKKGEHIVSHRLIHEGLERYEKVLSEVKADPKSYSPDKLRSSLDSFRTVLFDHLRDEVHDLGAESVFSHGFTLNELRRFPM